MHTIKNIPGGLTISAITIVIVVVLLEIAIRILGFQGDEKLLFDPVLGYVPKPNAEMTRSTSEYTVTKHTTSEGFWGKEYPHEKSEDVTRVVVLGDSFTEARHVENEDSYTEVMERYLNAHGTGTYEVVNLGRGGYGTRKERYILEHFGLAYEPDIVVVGFFIGNDIMNNLKEREIDENTTLSGWALAQVRTKSFLINNFAIVRFYLEKKARNKFFGKVEHTTTEEGYEIPSDYNVFLSELPEDAQQAYQLTYEELERIQSLTEEYGAELFVALFPDKIQVHEALQREEYVSFDYERPNDLLATEFTNHNIVFLDLLIPFRDYAEQTGESLYYPIDSHFNAQGHSITGELVAQYLLKQYEQK